MEHYQYKINSVIEEIAPIIDNLEEKWQAREIDAKTIFALRLCLEEAITNAVLHGNQNNPGAIVTIDCVMLDKAVEITVSDEGKGFDYTLVADPTLEQNISKARGRGLFIIKNFMDSVEFADNGKTIRLRKLLNKTASTIQEKEPRLLWDWEKSKNLSVIILSGQLNLDTTFYFKKEMAKLPPQSRLIIDCARLQYIDSTGLSSLIELREKIEQTKGILRLCSLNESVNNLFETTRLNTLFSIFPNATAAREGL